MSKNYFRIILILNQIISLVFCFKNWKNLTDVTFSYKVDLIHQGIFKYRIIFLVFIHFHFFFEEFIVKFKYYFDKNVRDNYVNTILDYYNIENYTILNHQQDQYPSDFDVIRVNFFLLFI
jgi:hypothetical protein